MTDDSVTVETYEVAIPRSIMDVFNPLAYEVPDSTPLREHESTCPECTYVTDAGHDCPDCECQDEYWEHCPGYRALYESLKEPALAEDGHHMRMSEQMDRHLRQALFSMGPVDTPTFTAVDEGEHFDE